jgi:hypothetical protein
MLLVLKESEEGGEEVQAAAAKERVEILEELEKTVQHSSFRGQYPSRLFSRKLV